MKDVVKVVMVIPTALWLVVAVVHRLIRGWALADQTAWILSLMLMFGIWFPFFLIPYLRKRSPKL